MLKEGEEFVRKHPATTALALGAFVAGAVVATRMASRSQGGSPLAQAANTLRETREHLDPRQKKQPTGRVESMIAVFSATLIAKGLVSYLGMRSRQALANDHGSQARSRRGDVIAGSEELDSDALQEHTVDELRQEAARRDITGRSSMRKAELVDAIVEDEDQTER